MKELAQRLGDALLWLELSPDRAGTGACVMTLLFLMACNGERPWNQTASATELIDPSRVPVEGALDIADCERIHGWAWAPSLPDASLPVEIVSGNDILATATADEFRQDLVGAGKGGGRHAFTVPTPVRLLDGGEHTVFARVRGSKSAVGQVRNVARCSYHFPENLEKRKANSR